jgi:pantoate--beta-alanine ligase
MGFLHEGHLSLIRCAVGCCDKVITTLFVNPLQFGPNEDLDAYPRDFERDVALATAEKVDVLFCPEPAVMYGENFQTTVSVASLSEGLCGADRPGHFDGVATVVTKLFNLTRPHVAIFGQKDFQQLALIKQLVEDLNFDIEIIGHPIVREKDGLAMSSRNKYLATEERKVATCLYKAIVEAKNMFRQSAGLLSAGDIEKMAHAMIEIHPECRVEYVKVVNRYSLKRVETVDNDSAILLAMKVNNKVRLIDNSPLSDE